MNMNENPTAAQFAALIFGYDDDAAHHILWVRRDGQVMLSDLPDGMTPATFGERPDLTFRYETMPAGAGYVGAEAAASDTYVTNRFRSLVNDWRAGRTGFID